ncbi:unnamed protein product [Rotaria sp. Silwood2]|nr:unnamed protein product [Rotaria sp. Silwood2]
MTFNIRFDVQEHDPNNHFIKRVYRLTETIEKWQPSILSVQEPFTNYIQHWQSHLPKYYDCIGYQSDREHQSSDRDYQVAILYNNQLLKLLEQDYIWLSKTPHVVDSKYWDSLRARTLNIARLKLINDDQHANILVFNTHLDVTSEEARREQANIVRTTIEQWHNKYPKTVALLFGDFNSIPKQISYKTLTSGFLHDT